MRSSKRAFGVGLAVAVVAMLAMTVGASGAFASEFQMTRWPIAMSGHSGAVTLQAESGDLITCERSSSTYELGSWSGGHMFFAFTGKCELKAEGPFGERINESCPTTTSEELRFTTAGDLGGPTVGETTKAGILFTGPGNVIVNHFDCGSVEVHVTGSLLCETAVVGKLTYANDYVCKQTSAGGQEFTTAEIQGEGLIEASLGAESSAFGGLFKATESDALTMTDEVEFGAPVEQTA